MSSTSSSPLPSKLNIILNAITDIKLSNEEKTALLDELNKPVVEVKPSTISCCSGCTDEMLELRKDLDDMKATLNTLSSTVSQSSCLCDISSSCLVSKDNLDGYEGSGCPFGFGMAIDIDFSSIIRFIVITICLFSIVCSFIRIFNSSSMASRIPSIPRPSPIFSV